MTRLKVFVLLLVFTFGSLSVVGQSKPLSRDTDSLRESFLDILRGEKIPGGVVILKKECGKEKMAPQPKLPVTSLEKRLDFIVQTNPDYRVVFDSEVINLIPMDQEPDILKTQISEFLIDTDLAVTIILEQLLQLKEINTKADAIGLNKGLQIGGGLQSPRGDKPQAFVHITNVTLREALNRIARAYGHSVWVYTESRCKGEERNTLSFPVQLR